MRSERLVIGASLAAAVALSWLYLVPAGIDMYGDMDGLSAWMMTARWDAAYFLQIVSMWAVMMVGMMLPSASPTILLYARTVRAAPVPEAPLGRTYAFAAGYLLVWIGFSVAAASLQAVLARTLLMSPMMEVVNPALGAAILLFAGVYQWTPFKHRCLAHCRSPLQWLSRRWRPGVGGALRMGITHGGFCLGCCWAAMLLLFVGGVMNLLWIAFLTVFVLLEKLARPGAWMGRAGGAVMAAAGVWLAVRAAMRT